MCGRIAFRIESILKKIPPIDQFFAGEDLTNIFCNGWVQHEQQNYNRQNGVPMVYRIHRVNVFILKIANVDGILLDVCEAYDFFDADLTTIFPQPFECRFNLVSFDQSVGSDVRQALPSIELVVPRLLPQLVDFKKVQASPHGATPQHYNDRKAQPHQILAENLGHFRGVFLPSPFETVHHTIQGDQLGPCVEHGVLDPKEPFDRSRPIEAEGHENRHHLTVRHEYFQNDGQAVLHFQSLFQLHFDHCQADDKKGQHSEQSDRPGLR
mmetsp:Transcript_19733/g.26008  ORF Transcript_19733/g.26008 Transcript_19733/m.26008 type:complete len:267 (-) Transcript_19733:2238-3038(-)